jgi:serine/threonine protein kinase/HAMP domain-containing protein
MPQPTEPTKIGRYEVERLVGEGAMAKVYRARDPEIDRIVAIKVLKDELCIDEEIAGRFIREAKAAGAIQHPNIVTIYDVGRIGNNPYITMEFIDEKSLAEVFQPNTRMPVKRVLDIGIQLARALDHAHRRGIVHRDIKPGNILLMQNGETVKITDFGIARLNDADEMQKTHAGMVLGTPRYMSPEQAKGNDIDGRSDLYSLGVILYELLSGRKAFDSESVATLMLQILQQDPKPLRELAPDVPVGMQRIVSKLLQKRPERRFQNGVELAEALERERAALIEQEEDAQRNKFIPLRIKWAAAAGAGLTLVFLIGLIVVYSIESRVIRTQVLDSGAALAKFVATQTAVPVLSQNWVPLELFVRDASQRGSFDFLVVTDHDNVVKAATDTSLVGKKYVPLQNADLVLDTPDLKASSVALADGNDVFLFDTPILFQQTEIGRVRLGLNRAGMDRVLGSTLLLMSVLGALAVLAVIAMVYVFGGLLSRPLRLLSKTLTDFGAGDLDRRVSGTRKDEIGQLFSAFNHMADAIQAKFGKRSVFGDSAMTPVDGDRVRAMEQSGTMDATLATVSKRSPEGAGA